jgi:hypothetical protein
MSEYTVQGPETCQHGKIFFLFVADNFYHSYDGFHHVGVGQREDLPEICQKITQLLYEG